MLKITDLFDNKDFIELKESEEEKITGGANYATYTVERGDTLSEITEIFYGDGTASCYKPVAKRNGISNPNLIRPGKKIKIYDYVAGCGYSRLSEA
ncbi:LysM peptidoglycan-binding domain-containing protein [Nostoc sp. XA010]|jgi:nucleoid-associated protein YgaU|uniref:LysM peptidoglycan-binding domain-containing protein n=1 Tax=Nostoc sp. XA010 TaxID=2780407 RepID=UPI001E405BA9|nr:LysM peptidoglycan-binding domain-containing protein [Nostoc sp. XA010]MCC5661865.1 LysM peptidoglycan-binding domain-containing protein [Nostoc sp. XA010]